VDAVRLIIELMILEANAAIVRRHAAAIRSEMYDPYSLATRPLPTGLRLFPHPKGISAEAARRITAGAVG
jgi:hypothetical protein